MSQLGIFWGLSEFFIVESNKSQIIKKVHIPLNAADSSTDSTVPDDLKFKSVMEKALSDLNITSKSIYLSLATKDLIFRSFNIPWMQPDEIQNVVEFEITKYIPFKLENLSYTFYPFLYIEGGQKNYRVLFVGARKDLLERYLAIFEQTGFQVDHIEPSAVSLSRILSKHNHINSKKCHAIVCLGKNKGSIFIIENEIVQFNREFQPIDAGSDHESVKTHIFNDLRVSFNFYGRQNTQSKIDNIVLLSEEALTPLDQEISDEFGIEAQALQTDNLIEGQEIDDIGFLYAFGASLGDKGYSSKSFDLSTKSAQLRKSHVESLTSTNIKTLVKVAVSCILIVVSLSVFSHFMVTRNSKKASELKQKLGQHAKLSAADLEKMIKTEKSLLNKFHNIRTETNMLFLLSYLPQLLPEGTWLNNLNLEYYDKVIKKKPEEIKSGVTMRLDGQVFNKNPLLQMKFINKLVSSFRNDEKLKEYCSNLDYKMSKSSEGKYSTTSFHLKCN